MSPSGAAEQASVLCAAVLCSYLPLLGFVFAAVSSTLGAAFFVGGRDLFDFALAYLRRWNTAWMMLSFLAFLPDRL